MSKNTLKLIPLDRIKDPERPMRTNLTPESVDELVFSIKEVGIIQPLTVCESDGNYEVIAGHRRFLAAEIAGLAQAPCIVVEADDLEREVLKMHENIAREDINPIDWAKHLKYLQDTYKLDVPKLAELTKFSTSWVQQHLQILEYPDEVLEAVDSGKLAFSAARELSQIKNPTTRKVYVNAAVKGGVTPAMAAQWRRAANSTPISSEVQIEEGQPTEITDVPLGNLPNCPVCNLAIEPQDIVTLVIHRGCQPTPDGDQTPS